MNITGESRFKNFFDPFLLVKSFQESFRTILLFKIIEKGFFNELVIETFLFYLWNYE